MAVGITLTGRADLLRALSRSADAVEAQRFGAALGFSHQVPAGVIGAASVELGPVESQVVVPEDEAPVSGGPRPPLQTSFFALTGYRKLPDPTPEEKEAERARQAEAASIQPLTDRDCEPTGQPLPFQPLVRRERLWPRLRQSLRQGWAAGVDVPRLVAGLSRGELPRRLPLRRHTGLTAQVFVLWDAADRLTPYAEDYRRLIAELHHLHGASGLRLWRVHDGPDDVWGEWAPERVAWPERWPGRSWRKGGDGAGDAIGLPEFPAGSRVLLLSDLGSLARHPTSARRWHRALRRWRVTGVATTAWLPCGPRWVAPALVAQVDEAHCLTSTPRPLSAMSRTGVDSLPAHFERQQAQQNELCDELLVRASICIHLEPALLRSLRHTLPALAAEPGLEALAWSRQPVVRSSRVSRALAPEVAPEYRQRFAALSEVQQTGVLHRVLSAHAALGRSTPVTEVLLWAAHARAAVCKLKKKYIDAAGNWVQAWSRGVEEQSASGSLRPEAIQYASDALARLGSDAKLMAQQSDWASRLALTAGHRTVPAGISADAFAAASRSMRLPLEEALHLWPHERNQEFVLAASGTWVPKYVLHPELHIEARHCLISRADDSCEFHSRPTWEVKLAQRGQPGQQIHLRSDRAKFTFTELSRPAWAVEWGRDDFGLFATLEVAGIPQRMRHLPPGRFLMGSPNAEPGCSADEGPQHEVTLTRGIWLGDTCCTQALWLAVKGGKNPSQFTGDPALPVDSVSWSDVQTFLERLQRQLPPGVEVVLPTEAQWEYACRSGTTTRFCVGDDIAAEHANFGNILRKTVDVKALPPNAWGYHQMHGNVWEWCADAHRKYRAKPVEDPDGGQRSVECVLRGGSWSYEARWARSASRLGAPRNLRSQSFGFRFALRSIEPGAGAGGGIGRRRAKPVRVLPQTEPGAGVGPAAPGPRADLDDPKFRAFLKSLIDKRGG